MIHVVVPIHPDKANQTQHPRPKGSILVEEMEVVISPFPKRKVPPYYHQPKASWVLWPETAQRGYGSRTICKVASWWHLFPVKVAFAATKDIDIKLSLKGMEIVYL